MKGGLFGLLGRPRRFRQITLDGLEINIPPGGSDFADHYNRAANPESADQRSSSPLHIEQLESTDAVLRLIPKRAGKQPREFLIHRLTMQGVGITQRMPFKAELTNPIPRGAISTEGRFGPWGRDVPSATPVEGTYVFQNADLSTIKGIGGILTSTGEFHGPLGRIEVKGETKTPDFRLERRGQPDAALDDVPRQWSTARMAIPTSRPSTPSLRKTPIAASGVIAGTPGVKGRTVQVDAKIADGRIEDLLRLSVKGQEPLLTGNLSLQQQLHAAAGTRRRRGPDAAQGQLRPVGGAVHQPHGPRKARRDERACERQARRGAVAGGQRSRRAVHGCRRRAVAQRPEVPDSRRGGAARWHLRHADRGSSISPARCGCRRRFPRRLAAAPCRCS